jgi:dimethylglycine dehydrogenase
LKSHVQVAVIGGGIVGCSILYHLAKLGWHDVVLLERADITAGSTWHAAGLGSSLYASPIMARMVKYSLGLWGSVEAETGQPVDYHNVGVLVVAETPDRLDEIKRIYGNSQRLGFGYEFLSGTEVAQRVPILDTKHVLGAIFDPYGGHIDPYGLTHAFAKGARDRGAEIYQHSPVVALLPRPDGSWRVETPRRTLTAEIIVNAAGFRANEIGALTGAQLPMMAYQHHYVITENLPEIEALDEEFPVLRNSDCGFYLRREGQGLLVGTYEKDARTFGENGIPPDFGQELLPDDLDRIAPFLEGAMERVPCFAKAGIKNVVNGPICFTPDHNPLLGWMPDQRNHFCAAGVTSGINMSGGIGLQCAEWIVRGQPSEDLTFIDVTRYGEWANGDFALRRSHEMYTERYKIHFPGEELASGRPLRKAPMYKRQKDMGAVFGTSYGWERPLWFAPTGTEPQETYSYRRQNWFEHVGAECRALREDVGIIDLQTFSNFHVSGPGAEAFLDIVMVNKAPVEPGKVVLTSMVNAAGGIIGDFTMFRAGDGAYALTGSGGLQGIHMRWFNANRPGIGVDIVNASDTTACFSVAGPRARNLLACLTNEDVSNDAFPFLAGRDMEVRGIDARVLRINFTGDLGYEIHVSLDDQVPLYEAIFEAGKDLGARNVGMRALDSLRIEKGWGRMGYEFTSDSTPFEVGLGWQARFNKGDFVGRDAFLDANERGPRWRLATLVLKDGDSDPWGSEPVYRDNDCIGEVTSGNFGHTVDRSIALALLRPDMVEPGTEVEVEILMERRRATVSESSLFDPTGERMRS